VRDFRVAIRATADAIARHPTHRIKPIFVFRGVGPTLAVYVFGKRVYSKGWTG